MWSKRRKGVSYRMKYKKKDYEMNLNKTFLDPKNEFYFFTSYICY